MNWEFYPFLVYPFCSRISLMIRHNFLNTCDQWRQTKLNDQARLSDVYDGEMWSKFKSPNNDENFFAQNGSLGFIDWFEPFKHQPYAIRVMYLAIMNLLRSIRFKRENIIILGLNPHHRCICEAAYV